MNRLAIRRPVHAGSWYPSEKNTLCSMIDTFFSKAQLPSKRPTAHALITPHAGIMYSGYTAAHGYSCVNLRDFDRIFLLGPSHHLPIRGLALSPFSAFGTPYGSIPLDTSARDDVARAAQRVVPVDLLPPHACEEEHSLEMQLPFLSHLAAIQNTQTPPIVPILVGAIPTAVEWSLGQALAPLLTAPRTLTVISSDFCHYGRRFGYAPPLPPYGTRPPPHPGTLVIPPTSPVQRYVEHPTMCPRHAHGGVVARGPARPDAHRDEPPSDSGVILGDRIEWMDIVGARFVAMGDFDGFSRYLNETQNTICGRHPICVFLAAIQSSGNEYIVRSLLFTESRQSHFLSYTQSERCRSPSDSSVSYVSLVFEQLIE